MKTTFIPPTIYIKIERIIEEKSLNYDLYSIFQQINSKAE